MENKITNCTGEVDTMEKQDWLESLKVAGVTGGSLAISFSDVQEGVKFVVLLAAAVYGVCKAIGAVLWLTHRLQRWWRGDKMDIGFRCPITGKEACPERFQSGPEKAEDGI